MNAATGAPKARTGRDGGRNGLADRVAAVEAARAQLGRDLDVLTVEARAQIGQTVEKTAWRVAATGLGIVASIIARKVLVSAWKSIQHSDPPANPAAPGTTWPESVAWALATGAGVAVARLVVARGAAAGWVKATGKLPPGLEEAGV